MNNSNFNMGGMGMGMQQPDPSQIQMQDRQNNQQIQRHVLQVLQAQKVPPGWQQSVQIRDRAMKIYQLISSLRLIQPRIEIHHAIGVATGFEEKAFEQAPDKASYERQCQEKLARIRDTRAKQAAAMQQAQNNQNMQPGMIQQMQQVAPNMTPNMGVPQGHPAMNGQNMNPNFRGNMDHILGQQQDGLRAQEAGSLVVPASNVPAQRLNAQQFPNMLQQQGANRGPVMNPGLAAQQQQQWNNAQQTQHEKMQSVHLQAQAQAQAQARLNMQARAAQQISMTGGGVNPQQIPVSQSPAMPMLNRPMNQVPQPQGTPQPRPPSHMPQFDGAQQPGPQAQQQRMVQNPMAMPRPPMPDWVPAQFREQLARMPDDQYRMMLHRMAQQHQTNIHRRQQALAQQQAQQQQGGQPQQQIMRQQVPNQQTQFNPQLQHPMQPTPLPISQPQQPQQPPSASNQNAQQRGDATLTEEENAQVNIMASEMAKTTPKAEMDKIRANLQNIAQEHKESLAKRGLDPLAFFFRSQALTHFKRNKAEMIRRQQMIAQNTGIDPISMPQQQQPRPTPQAPPMQMQGSQGQQPTTHAPPMVGQPGQNMPGQQHVRGPNGQPQNSQVQQNRTPQQQGQGLPQQPQRPQGPQGQQGLLRVPNDLTRGQQPNGPAMTDQQISTMDKMPFPNGIINPQNNGGAQLPKTVKTWGQLKQWATTQQGDQQGFTLQKLLTLQRLHFMQTMAQNKPSPANLSQLNGPMAVRPGQPAAVIPPPGQAPSVQLQNSQHGNQQRPVPMQSGIPEGWQPSIQEIQRARTRLPQHAQAWTDEMVRQFLFQAREHKMKELARQQQLAQQGQQANGQTQGPALQQIPASIPPQSRPQSQVGQRPGPPNTVGQQGPRGRGTPVQPQQPQQPQQPPPRPQIKRSNSDEVMEIPNPNQQPGRPPPTQAPPSQTMPINAPQPRQLPQLTREQYTKLPPDQQARYDALRQQAAARGLPLPGMSANDPETLRINMRLKQLVGEENQKLIVNPRPPVNMSPEQRQMMVQKLPQARDMLSRIDTAMRVGFKIHGDENQMRQIITKRILLYQQFQTTGQRLTDAPPAEHFTMTVEELESTIMMLKQYFTSVMSQVQPVAKGMQQPPAKPQPPEQMVLTAQNLQEFEKQHQAAQQKARQTEAQQQKQANNDSRAPPAPTSAAPPFALGPHSPQGIPRAYGETNALTQDKLKLPPAKKQKRQPNNTQASTGSTPAHVQGTPAAQSPQISKPPSPEAKKQPVNNFKCPVGGCEFLTKGFATQQELAKHGKDMHRPKEKPIENPVEFALENMRKTLGLDENGKMKTPMPDLQKAAAQAMKREESKQGATPKLKEEKPSAAGTPLNRPTSQIGKSALPAAAALKTPQVSNAKPSLVESRDKNVTEAAHRLSQELEIQFGKIWEDSSVSPTALNDTFIFVDPAKDFSASLGSDWGSESWQHVKYSSMLDTSSSSDEEHSPPRVGTESPKQRGTDVSKVVNLATLDLSVTPNPAAEKMDFDAHAGKKPSLDISWDNASTGSYDPLDDTWYRELKAKNPEPRGTKRSSEDRELAPEEMYVVDWDDVEMEVQDDGLSESEAWKEWFGNK